MAKKKFEKRIKRLKKRGKKAKAAKLTLEKRVRKLRKSLDARDQQIAALQERLDQTPAVTQAKNAPTTEFGDRGEASIASSHRAAWKRHSYLRDRYEVHLGAGATKERARQMANEDLKQAHGTDCGYTEDELSAILS